MSEATRGPKTLIFLGRTQDELSAFPKKAKREFGFALRYAQNGGLHADARHMKGNLTAVVEIRKKFDNVQYRTMYYAKFEEVVYCLHVFTKKSTKGISTPQRELHFIATRLREAKTHYAQNYSTKKKN